MTICVYFSNINVNSDNSYVHNCTLVYILLRWRKVRERYYWKNSYEDVKRYIEEFDQCQRKAPLKKAQKPLRPIPVKSNPFCQIGMDLVGPLEKTVNGEYWLDNRI